MSDTAIAELDIETERALTEFVMNCPELTQLETLLSLASTSFECCEQHATKFAILICSPGFLLLMRVMVSETASCAVG